MACLKAIIKGHDLILNNASRKATTPTRRNVPFIINLTITSPEIGALYTWIIDDELFTLFDHEVSVCNLSNLNETVGGMGTSQEVTGWSVKVLLDEKKRHAKTGTERQQIDSRRKRGLQGKTSKRRPSG